MNCWKIFIPNNQIGSRGNDLQVDKVVLNDAKIKQYEWSCDWVITYFCSTNWYDSYRKKKSGKSEMKELYKVCGIQELFENTVTDSRRKYFNLIIQKREIFNSN